MTGVPAHIIPGGASIGSTVVRVNLPRGEALGELDIVETSPPVGAYADAEVTPTCGLAGPDAIIGLLDDPTAFGGQRGQLTPTWWGARNSQYGVLKWRGTRTTRREVSLSCDHRRRRRRPALLVPAPGDQAAQRRGRHQGLGLPTSSKSPNCRSYDTGTYGA